MMHIPLAGELSQHHNYDQEQAARQRSLGHHFACSRMDSKLFQMYTPRAKPATYNEKNNI
jgi:hypothetical protein